MNARGRHFLAKFQDPKILRFLFAGGLNTVFGYAVYALLLLLALPYLVALFLATIGGVIFNYFCFGRVVFQGRTSWNVFFRFILAYSAIYVVNAGLLMLLTQNFSLGPYAGQIVCIPFSIGLSWVLMNHWVYKKD